MIDVILILFAVSLSCLIMGGIWENLEMTFWSFIFSVAFGLALLTIWIAQPSERKDLSNKNIKIEEIKAQAIEEFKEKIKRVE